jgi:hypothetical protein
MNSLILTSYVPFLANFSLVFFHGSMPAEITHFFLHFVHLFPLGLLAFYHNFVNKNSLGKNLRQKRDFISISSLQPGEFSL